MSMSTRRTLWYVVLPLLVLTVLGSLVFWVVQSRLSQNVEVEPTQLASVALPVEPGLLAWSADGSYLAAGTGYKYGGWVEGPGKVFIVDVGKEAVAATLDTAAAVEGLAFSPDGKWLAAATRTPKIGGNPGLGQAELVVFAVPDFTAKLKAKSELRILKDGRELPEEFGDIAWAADGKSLHAIHGGRNVLSTIRRWNAPEFVEQPAVSEPDYSGQYRALAVAPDRLTLALVAGREFGPGVLQLLDLEKGTTIASIKDLTYTAGHYRVAFTVDGKTVGVFAESEAMPLLGDIFDPDGKQKRKQQRMAWWDVGTAKPTNPAKPRFAVQPASQAESRYYSISPDSRIWAHTLLFQDVNDPGGRFVVLTQTETAKTWTWRVGTIDSHPSLAFSPDGTKLAGTLETPSGWTIAIWAVP